MIFVTVSLLGSSSIIFLAVSETLVFCCDKKILLVSYYDILQVLQDCVNACDYIIGRNLGTVTGIG